MVAAWLNNVTNLTEERKIKIGEFEKLVDVSQGYFSRIRNKMDNEGSVVYPPVSVLQNISRELGISIDMLMNYELPANFDNLRTLKNVLAKFIRDTNDRKIVWDKFSGDDLLYDGYKFTGNLFQKKLIADNTPPEHSLDWDPDRDYREYSKEYYYHSEFNKNAVATGDFYKGTISDYEYIYIVSVSVEGQNGWEMYLEGRYDEYYGSNFEKLLSTLEKPTDTLSSEVGDLIMCIRRNSKDAYIGFALRGLIDDYMKK